VAVIGTGLQARKQIEALRVVRPGFGHVRVWGRDAGKAAACAADLSGPGCEAVAVPTVREAVAGAQVVITCTASREPLVELGWLAAGAHVTSVGSDGDGKQELDPQILHAANVIAVDSRRQSASLGELQHALDQAERAVELGALIIGEAAGRTSEDQLTVCDLTGVGVQDVAAANVVMARAGEAGTTLEV
jgi:ornithine cyclodeaminase